MESRSDEIWRKHRLGGQPMLLLMALPIVRSRALRPSGFNQLPQGIVPLFESIREPTIGG